MDSNKLNLNRTGAEDGLIKVAFYEEIILLSGCAATACVIARATCIRSVVRMGTIHRASDAIGACQYCQGYDHRK